MTTSRLRDASRQARTRASPWPPLARSPERGATRERPRRATARRQCTAPQLRFRITPELTASAAAKAGEIVLALEARSDPFPGTPAEHVARELRRRFPGRTATVLLTRSHSGQVSLVAPDDPGALAADGVLPLSLTRGGISGRESALRALLQEGIARDASVLALVAGVAHDDSADWLGGMLSPILDGEFDYVRPSYFRPATAGTLNTGIVYPLTRALYGRRLRQPLGGEAALSPALARRLLEDRDWARDPEHAGSDAWLLAKVLTGRFRVCQSWLGAWPHEAVEPEDVSRALARVIGPVFREMERNGERWQRIDGSQPVESSGASNPTPAEPAPLDVAQLVDAFRLGVRDLAPLWGLVVPPAALLLLRRAAAVAPDAFRIPDALWARVVYDFAVGHFAKTMERNQLLASMTPLYMGWVASFLNEVRGLDAEAAETRVEALCGAFEREKRYLITHWRWPEGFKP